LPQVPLGVKDVAVTGNVRAGRVLARPEAHAAVGDGVVGLKAATLQVQQVRAPGGLVAMILVGQKVTVGGTGVDAHQHRLAGLEDLVVNADTNGRQVLGLVDVAGRAAASWRIVWMEPSDGASSSSKSDCTTA
jgi:hypothetical protein